MILDSRAELQDVLQQVERAAVEDARAQGATWSLVAEALNQTRQAEQRFGQSVAVGANCQRAAPTPSVCASRRCLRVRRRSRRSSTTGSSTCDSERWTRTPT